VLRKLLDGYNVAVVLLGATGECPAVATCRPAVLPCFCSTMLSPDTHRWTSMMCLRTQMPLKSRASVKHLH
jgi:hypothetical protein